MRYCCLHYGFDKLFNINSVKKTVDKDLLDSNFTYSDLIGKSLIIDFRAEGHRPEDIIHLIDYLTTLIPLDKILVIFNAVTQGQWPYKYINASTFLVNSVDVNEDPTDKNILNVDKKFLCLNRRPSLSRARFLSSLFKTVNREDVRASFGANQCASINEYRPFFKERLPILIDDPPVDQYRIDEKFKTCLFNIIPESSSQSDANVWKSIFITEKTFKCFKMLQIPIWVAVPGLVKEVRNLGFDVFDDIIDHSYDNIQNEHDRMNQVLKVILDIDHKYRLSICENLRNQLLDRMLKNKQLLTHYRNNNQITYKELEKLL